MGILSIIGLLTIVLILAEIARFFYLLFFAKGRPIESYNTKFSSGGADQWALVTGASDGIGKEFAIQLASKGFNVAILARSQDKLEEISKTIKTKYGVKTLVLPFDCSITNDDEYLKLLSNLEELNISVLINNVGRSESFFKPFALSDLDTINQIININILATLKITKLLLPLMIERNTQSDNKSRCLIMNVGSMSGVVPIPYLGTYGASKSFLAQWTASLGVELKEHNIDCMIINPGLVATNMSKVAIPSFKAPMPDVFVAKTLDSICLPIASTSLYACVPWAKHAYDAFTFMIMSRTPLIGQYLQEKFVELMLARSKKYHQRSLAKQMQSSGSN